MDPKTKNKLTSALFWFVRLRDAARDSAVVANALLETHPEGTTLKDLEKEVDVKRAPLGYGAELVSLSASEPGSEKKRLDFLDWLLRLRLRARTDQDLANALLDNHPDDVTFSQLSTLQVTLGRSELTIDELELLKTRKILAIKAVKLRTGLSLLEAKELVDRVEAGLENGRLNGRLSS